MNSLRSFPKSKVKKIGEEKYKSQRAAVFKGKQPQEYSPALASNDEDNNKIDPSLDSPNRKPFNSSLDPCLEIIKEEGGVNEHAKRIP